jgi:hypothetical protein
MHLRPSRATFKPTDYLILLHYHLQGWTTDGKTPACNTDVDECTMNKPPCSVNPLVQCINLPGSFHCGNCPAGKYLH